MSMNISHIIISSCENNEWNIIKECLATCPINHSFYIQHKARLGEATRQISRMFILFCSSKEQAIDGHHRAFLIHANLFPLLQEIQPFDVAAVVFIILSGAQRLRRMISPYLCLVHDINFII